MNVISLRVPAPLLAALAFVITLTACGDSADRQRTASAPAASSTSAATTTATPAPTPTPPADTAGGNANASRDDTAKASDDALKAMDKDEEAKTMPRPSQANDHSTLAPKRSEQ